MSLLEENKFDARILPEFLREIKSSIQDNSIGEKD